MAETRVKIVDIQVNVAEAIKALGGYAVAIEEAQRAQKALAKDKKSGKITDEQYTQQLAIEKEVVKANQQAQYRLSQELQNQSRIFKANEGSIFALKSELRAATIQYENMSRAERESAAGTNLKAHLAEIKKELTAASLEATNMYKNMGDTSNVETGLGSITKKIKDMAMQMAAIATGGSIIRLGQSAVEIGRKFYDGMAQVKAVTQATDGEMSKLTDTARELGRTTKFHATDAAKAMENLSRGGFNTNEVLMSINKTLEMAQANAIDLDTSSDVLIRALRGFKMPVDEKNVSRVADVLSQASRKSATNVTEMAQAFKNAAPFAGALNIPIEQVSAALGVLADSGTRGADAGTAMRMALLGLANPTSKAGKVFKEYGITIDQVELKQKGLAGVFEELEKSGIFKDQNSMAKLSTIFGRRTVSNVINLIGNLDRYKQKLIEVENAQGTTAQMFKQSLDPASNALYTLSSAWEDFKIGLYNLNSGALKGFAETLTSLIQFMTANLPTITAAITNLVMSFSLAKVAQSVVANVQAMSSTIVMNAQEASTAVQNSQTKEDYLRRQTATLTAELEQIKAGQVTASAEKQQLVETQLATRKQQLATQTATTAKLKVAEVEAWSNAKAISTGTGWAKGLLIAKTAFVSFAATAKAMIRSVGIMFAISLAIEGITKLYDLVSGMFNKVDKQAEQHKVLMNEIANQNNEITKAGVKQASREATRLNLLHEAAKNVNRSNNERLQAIRKIQAVAPGYHATIDKTGRLIENNVKAIDAYIKKLRKQAEAEAAMSIYKKNAERLLQLDMSDADSDQKINNVKNAVNMRRENGQSKPKQGQTQVATRDSKGNVEVISADEAEKRKRDQYNINKFNQRKQNNAQERAAINKQQQYLEGKYRAATKSQQEVTKSTSKGSETTNIVRQPSEADLKEQEKAANARETAANKAARIAEQQASKEQKAIKAMHDAMEATMLDTIEKRRISITNQYTDEINKLKSRLATERNLTEKAKDAINETIKYKQIKLNQELAKLSDESLKEELARQHKYIASRLSVTQKGTQDELNLRKQQIENNRKQSQLDLNKEEETATRGKQDKVDTAKTEMDKAKSKLDKDKENGADAETINADMNEYQQKVANYTHMQQELTNLTEQYNQRRADINEKARQDELTADQNFETQKEANRQMAVQTQITEMDASLLQDQDYQERKRAQQQLGIDVVNQEEMNQMQLERDNAQAHLDFINEQGQLEGETQEQYQQRQAEAKLALAQKESDINNAEVKNEQAKQKAFESVGNSLISVFEAVGESNSAMAKMAKVISLAQIAIDTGKALSAGIASASSLPYPANLAAIATTVATVLANVATAITTVKSAKFATGGKVIGPGTGTSDSIPAQLSNGEYVMTAKATRMFEPLLAAMNGIGAGVPIASNRNYSVIQNTNDMTDSFTEAAQTIRPVVSVEEITDVQNRVETIQNIDNV